MRKPSPLKGRKQDPEVVKRRARKCEEGCTCGRHKFSLTPEQVAARNEKIRQAKEAGVYARAVEKRAVTLANRTDEEKERERRNRSEARKKMWAEGVYDNAKPATKRRTSKTEEALAPILERLGYEHVNEDNPFFIPVPGRKGFVPDFVDRKNKRVFEYFGNFWHHPDDEEFRVGKYREAGWECTVLWEYDLAEWVAEHSEHMTEDQAETLLAFSQMRGVLASRGNPEARKPE